MSTAKPKTTLPVGAKLVEREPAEESFELAEQLARKGASDSLIRAVGGEKALRKLRRASANGAK